MARENGMKRWTVNVVSFVLLSILALTGMVNWLLLPRGRGDSGIWISVRHFLRDVHEMAAVLFIAAIAIHIALHWAYIRFNLMKKSR